MKKVIMPIVALIYCTFLSGFAGLADYGVVIHDDYELIRSSGHQIAIWYIGDNSNKQYSDNCLISPKVVEVNYSDQYIIAKRSLLIPEKMGSTYNVSDASVSLYYIIDMDTFEIYPDMTEEEYLEKRKSLEIPEGIQLLSINRFRMIHDEGKPFSIWKFVFG